MHSEGDPFPGQTMTTSSQDEWFGGSGLGSISVGVARTLSTVVGFPVRSPHCCSQRRRGCDWLPSAKEQALLAASPLEATVVIVYPTPPSTWRFHQ